MKPNQGRWTRREFIGSVAGAAAAASLPKSFAAQVLVPKKKPNVLLIMSDDMRVELGCYNSVFHGKTPHLDELARTGVRFDRNYCQFPLCNPSRSSLLTGRKPTTTRVLGNRDNVCQLQPDWISLPRLFRQNGYVSIREGKIFHGAGIDDPNGWDNYHARPGAARTAPENSASASSATNKAAAAPAPAETESEGKRRAAYSDRIVILDGNGEGHGDYHTADLTIEHLRANKDRPFFIGCGFVKPHSPPTAPKKFFDLYYPEQIKLTADFAPSPTVPPGFPSAAIRKHNADLFIGRDASEKEAREVIRAYLASISWADWNIGRVLGELDALGLRQNTIVVFLADHGYQLGEKGKWSKAGSLFEMGTRVPFIISAPDARGTGRASPRIVESLDLYPTLAELCGLPGQAELEGTSLVPLLQNPSNRWDKPAYSIWSEDGRTIHGTAVRTEQWRYAEYGKNGANGSFLIDSHADPLEIDNLAEQSKFASVVAELSALTRKYAAGLA